MPARFGMGLAIVHKGERGIRKMFNRGIHKLVIAGLLTLALAGCRGGSNQAGGPPPPPNVLNPSCTGSNCTAHDTTTPTTTDSNTTTGVPAIPDDLPGGNNQIFTPVNMNAFKRYLGAPVNNPGGVKITLEFNPSGTPQVFFGNVHIRFNDRLPNGTVIGHDGYFQNGNDRTQGNDKHILTVETSTNTPTYRFFVEDRAGSLIILLQPEGDITTATTLKGQVWFRNFNTAAPNPLFSGYYDGFGSFWPSNPFAFCWSGVITTGPYDCRNYNVMPDTGSGAGYTLLGSMTGIDKSKALGL